MAKSDARATARDELREDVALMRALGVARWGEIYLGPPPPPDESEMTDEEKVARADRAARQRHETLFAATSIRPKFPKRAPEPESVVQRSRPQEHDRGPRKSA